MLSQRQMAQDMGTEFDLKLKTRQLEKAAARAAKDLPGMRKEIQNFLKEGKTNQAAQKARTLLVQEAHVDHLKQAADMAKQALAQVQANNATKRMTAMIAQSSKTMSRAQKQMNPEKTLVALEQFKNQNEEYAMSNSILQDAMTQSTSVQASDDAVHELLGKLADDAGVELSQELASASASKVEPVKETAAAEPTPEIEDALQQRLRALRS